jgi:hypothetical protein
MASMVVGDLTLESLHQVWMHLYIVFYFLLLTPCFGAAQHLPGKIPSEYKNQNKRTAGSEYLKK